MQRLTSAIATTPLLAVVRQANSEFIGFTPLHTACVFVNVDAVRFFVDPDQPHNQTNGTTITSSSSSCVQTPQRLQSTVNNNSSIGINSSSWSSRVSAWDRDLYGRTPLHMVFFKGVTKANVAGITEICKILMVQPYTN
jgi:ankyrin repeat protein